MASIALSWLTVHTLFTLHYAELYYGGGGDPAEPGAGKAGGIDFGLAAPPGTATSPTSPSPSG